MQYGILGDIHANLQALEAVFGALDEAGVSRFLCLGDLVGYGADPAPCIDLVRARGAALVGGNHDWAVAGRLSLDYFNRPARAALQWTRRILPRDTLAWLGGLDLVRVAEGVTLAHGTVHEPQLFDYLTTPYDAYLSFRAMETDIGFVGHSHVPVTFFDGHPVSYTVDTEIPLAGRRALANVGSIGQPRDEDPRAAYGIYDSVSGVLRIHRVAYDIDGAAARIREAGLPEILAERLHLGR